LIARNFATKHNNRLQTLTLLCSIYKRTEEQQKIVNQRFEQAKKDFPDYKFFFYEHDKNKNISEKLNIKFWTTIAIYKDGKEVAREIGLDKKEEIYELLKKGI